MITATMSEAKSRLSELVAAAGRGETVVIQHDGKPAARIVPANPCFVDHFKDDLRLRVVFHEDPALPVPDDAWPESCR